MSQDLGIIVLAGKIINRNVLVMESHDNKTKDDRWLSCLFTLKLRNRFIEELPPQIIKNFNEPMYQARFISNWKELGLKTEYLISATRISSMFILEFVDDTWEVICTLTNIHTSRKAFH